MRNFVILGASALVLALGVAQASAAHQSNVQAWADYVARTSAQPAYTGELRDFPDQPADVAIDRPLGSGNHLSSGNHHSGR